jgi:hypothetical protein
VSPWDRHRLASHDFDAANVAAHAYADQTGGRFVEDGAEPAIPKAPARSLSS